jgi:AcrR family transcriptional regulator
VVTAAPASAPSSNALDDQRALYHHFNSNEALAVAIIDQAFGIRLKTFQGISRASAPALQSMIHGVLVVGELANADKLVRMGAVLLRIFAKSSEASALNYGVWLSEMGRQAQRAQVEEDLRCDIGAQAAGEFIVTAMLGTELISSAVSAVRTCWSASPEHGSLSCRPLPPSNRCHTYANSLPESRYAVVSRCRPNDAPGRLPPLVPELFGQVVECCQGQGVVIAHQRRFTHPGPDQRTVGVHQLDKLVRVLTDHRNWRLIGWHQPEELRKRHREQCVGGVSNHLGKCLVRKQYLAVSSNREGGHGYSLEHDSSRHLVEGVHR